MGLRWLADECVSSSVVHNLRAMEHDVLFIAEGLAGTPDRDVLHFAMSEGRLLLTQDGDYGDMLFTEKGLAVPGVVFLRVPSKKRKALLWQQLQRTIEEMGDSLLGRFVVISEATIRWRPLP